MFEKVFDQDVERLRSMEDLWKTRKPPKVLKYDQVATEASTVEASAELHGQRPWDLAENFVAFSNRYSRPTAMRTKNWYLICSSLRRLSTRMQEAQAGVAKGDPPAILTFDKDDDDALDFITASANLRSLVFGIEQKSRFDIKRLLSSEHEVYSPLIEGRNGR